MNEKRVNVCSEGNMNGRRRIGLRTLTIPMAVLTLGMISANAHHSSSLFYDVDKRITVTGQVTEFRFANPHAIVRFEVEGPDGAMQAWTAETTSPSILRRRGWSQQSFAPGETITLEGMPSLDGSWLMRITRAWREDGSEIGVPPGVND